MKLGDTIPAFSAITNLGKIDNFHEWIGESWAILFSHPADFTPVCTTELARAAQLAEKFQERNVQMIALSCDSPESHRGWISDIVAYAKDPNITSKRKFALGFVQQIANFRRKERDRGADTLVVRCPIRGSGKSRLIGFPQCLCPADPQPRCSRQLDTLFKGDGFPFEIIADQDRKLAVELGMLDPAEKDSKGMPLTARAVFIIDPSKKLRAHILYPATTGRNFEYV
ncbi:hypothetical protein Y032_0027g1535 [Ancylostoma ceylanicum]|uniref:Thioredoxin domain-containing protein n=1 Tax=Ancylostoma ceylanicum TaxID=53326 RepID=A0A016UUI1_9BILA|nr:hypothetical protein Y032_0027g1535 [Ancylostoma ceylanicum]